MTKIIYIVTQDLFGIVHKAAFNSLEEAYKCRHEWWCKFGKRDQMPVLDAQYIYDTYEETIKQKINVEINND